MIFNIAQELGVQHFVYNSLDHAQKLLANHGGYRCFGCDSKAVVAEYIELPDPKIKYYGESLLPVHILKIFNRFFCQNKDPNGPEQLIFTLPLTDKPMVMMALEDIGWFVKYSFENPDKAVGNNYYIAGDNISISDIVRIFIEVTGIKAKYNTVPLDQNLAAMPKFADVDFDIKEKFTGFFQQYLQEKVPRDLNTLKKIHPVLLDGRQWLLTTG